MAFALLTPAKSYANSLAAKKTLLLSRRPRIAPMSLSPCLSLSSTKRLIVDVIRFQPGETLTEILEGAASPEQVRH